MYRWLGRRARSWLVHCHGDSGAKLRMDDDDSSSDYYSIGWQHRRGINNEDRYDHCGCGSDDGTVAVAISNSNNNANL